MSFYRKFIIWVQISFFFGDFKPQKHKEHQGAQSFRQSENKTQRRFLCLYDLEPRSNHEHEGHKGFAVAEIKTSTKSSFMPLCVLCALVVNLITCLKPRCTFKNPLLFLFKSKKLYKNSKRLN
jgi:hypothetical protein